jgi:hypothetical protein
MNCHYCESKATCKCATCPMKFCDFCIEEHLQAKGMPRRSWNANRIMLEIEETGETNESTGILRRIGDHKD